jgi:hypothetical protein
VRSPLSRAANKPIRGLELAALEGEREPPFGRRWISKQEQVKRAEPVVGLLAHGVVPLDETSSQALAAVMDQIHRRMERGR